MKRLFNALAFTLALSLIACPPAVADDDEDSDNYSPISDCGTVINSPGRYRLVNDLIGCDVPDLFGRGISYGIGIASDDVVLDLGGNTISCLGGERFFEFGVFSEPILSRIRIRNGTVTGCGLGVNLNQSFGSTIEDMVLKGNGIGIEVLAGADNQVRNNSVLGNRFAGLLTTSYFGNPFFGGFFVGPGSSHKIHKNLVLFNGGGGIEANGIEDTVISCNRMDRNFDGFYLFDAGVDNTITRNVANDNISTGISLLGFDFPGFLVTPIPDGNTISKNTAHGNGDFDLGEATLGFAGFTEGSECLNTWNENAYGTQFALNGCIAPSVYIKDDDDDSDGCAPGLPSFDDGDENLLKDSSFEMRLRPDEGGWMLFGASWFNAQQARTGHQSMFNGGFSDVGEDGMTFGEVSGSVQNFPASPGSKWRLTGFGLASETLLGEPAFGIVQFSFFDEFGNDLGTVETADPSTPPAKISNEINAQSPVGEWIFLDTGVATAPEGAVTIGAFTLYVDFSASGVFQGVYFDDLSLCALDDDGECQEFDDDDDDSDSDSDSDSD